MPRVPRQRPELQLYQSPARQAQATADDGELQKLPSRPVGLREATARAAEAITLLVFLFTLFLIFGSVLLSSSSSSSPIRQ